MPLHGRLWVVSLAGVVAMPATAQPPEPHGLVAGVVTAALRWELTDGQRATDFAAGLHAGYRIALGRVAGARVSVTPRVALTANSLTGIPLGSTQVAVSTVDVLGAQLAARIGRFRPWGWLSRGMATTERYLGSDLVNHHGGARTIALGLELPRTNPCGAGLEIAWRRTTATLDEGEWRRPEAAPAGGTLRATAFTLGWSGRFRGARLLFACR